MSGKPRTQPWRTVAAVLAFVAAGHTLGRGAFRTHVARLVGFLEKFSGEPDRMRVCIESAIAAASTGNASDADWPAIARGTDVTWQQIEMALSR